jgi:hypothetical protein
MMNGVLVVSLVLAGVICAIIADQLHRDNQENREKATRRQWYRVRKRGRIGHRRKRRQRD